MLKSKAFKHALYVFICVRLLISIVGYFAVTTYSPMKPAGAGGYEKPQYSALFENVFGLWERADTLWYFHIARDGYKGDSDVAFFPLYPILVRILSLISFLPFIVSGLFVSNLCLLLAFYFLYKLCELDFNEETAKRAVWFQAVYPGTVFLFCAYTESLYLFLALASFYYARKADWLRAGIFGAFLVLTRNTGILICIPLLYEVYKSKKEKSIIFLGLIPLSFILYMSYWFYETDDPFIFIHRQDGWGRVPMLPWETLYEGFHQAWLFWANPPGGFYVLDALCVGITLVVSVVLWNKLRPSYLMFSLLSLLPALCAPYPGRMLVSFIRFTAVLFPTSIGLAVLCKDPKKDFVFRAVFLGLFALVAALFLTSSNMI